MHTSDIRCPKCGNNEWYDMDGIESYDSFCSKCSYRIPIYKQSFLDDFTCPECNCFSGKLEENNKFIAVRCQNCGKQHIVFEKHTDSDIKERQRERQARESASLRCPKCGSTSVTTGARGVNATFGLFGASKTANRCGKCGHTWKPKR